MLTSSGQVTVTVTELDPVLGTTGSFLTVTVATGVAASGPGGGVTDHGDLTGLGDDDHTQYLTNARGDVRYDASGAAATAQAAAIAAAATDATTKANAAQAAAVQRANHTGSQAISTVTGLQTALDGKETSGAAAAAQAASQPLDADLTIIAALDSTTAGALTTDGSGWIRKTYAQLKTALSLVKADVGLGSVDNTADTAKPVSTAQQTALDLKANLASPTFTGNPAAPTASPGDNDTSIATTAFVTAAVAAGGGGGGAGAPNFAIGAYTTPDSNTGFNDTGVDGSYWNGGWRASTTAAQNDKVGWNVLLNAGTYNFEFVHLKASGSGIGNVYLDGVSIGTFDAYAAGATANNRSTISGVTTSAGAQLLEIRMATKNASSSAYGLLLHGFMVRQTA